MACFHFLFRCCTCTEIRCIRSVGRFCTVNRRNVAREDRDSTPYVLSSFHATHYFMRKTDWRLYMKRVQRSVIRASSNTLVSFLLLFFPPSPSFPLASFFSPPPLLFFFVAVLSDRTYNGVHPFSDAARTSIRLFEDRTRPGRKWFATDPPTLSFSSFFLFLFLFCAYARGTVRRKRMHEHRRLERVSLAPFGQSASRTLGSQQCTRRGTSVRTRRKASPLSVDVRSLRSTPWNSIAETLRHKGFLFGNLWSRTCRASFGMLYLVVRFIYNRKCIFIVLV